MPSNIPGYGPLMYWSRLFLEISSSMIFSTKKSTLDFDFKFSDFKASIIESFKLIKLYVTMPLMLALTVAYSPRNLHILTNFLFKKCKINQTIEN